MVLDRSIQARRQRRKRWKRIYSDGAGGAGSLRGAHTGNDARLNDQVLFRAAFGLLFVLASPPMPSQISLTLRGHETRQRDLAFRNRL